MELTEQMYNKHSSIGFNSEYCPQVFFDKNYKSAYKNSLYKQVKYIIPYDFNYEEDYYSLSPVILEGSGQITVVSKSSPHYVMELTAKENAIIQMPLIYYPGYVITLENKETGEKTKLKGENVDGLIAFSITEGSYTVKTNYQGTTLRKISIALCTIGVLTVSTALFYEILKKERKNGKDT